MRVGIKGLSYRRFFQWLPDLLIIGVFGLSFCLHGWSWRVVVLATATAWLFINPPEGSKVIKASFFTLSLAVFLALLRYTELAEGALLLSFYLLCAQVANVMTEW